MRGEKLKPKFKPNSEGSLARSLALFGLITADFLGFTVGGAAAGYYGHTRWGLSQGVAVLFSFCGLGLAIYRLTRYVKRE